MVVRGEAIVFVLDAGKSMQNGKEYSSAFEDAKKCILRINQRKIFSESKDEMALIVIGDDSKTVEDADEDLDSKKQNISIIQDLKQANWKFYDLVSNIQCSNLPTDYIRDSGLDAAVNLLLTTVDRKKTESLRIMFLSDFDGYFYGDRINVIRDELKANNIELNFIGPVEFSVEIKSEICSEEFQSKNKATCHVLDIIREVNGDSFSFKDILDTVSIYQMKNTQSMPCNVNLEIGTLTIPISVFIKVTENKLKPWNSACAYGNGEKPKRTTTYCMNDENQTRVSSDDYVYAYKYGTTLVPYDENDKKNMEYQSGGKGMKLLGFTKASKVKRYTYVGKESKYVFGQKNDESAKEAVAAFTQALHDANMVAIVRFVSTPRSSPVIGFLSPSITEESECLVLVILPYMEDIRHFVFTSLDSDSKNVPSAEQLDAIDELITSMDLTKDVDEDDDCFLQLQKTPNPYVQRLFHCLEMRALHPEKPLPPIQPHILASISPLPSVLKRAETSLKKVQSLFPLKAYMPKKSSETESNLFPLRKSDEVATKNFENEDGPETKFNVTEANLMDAMTDKITEIGSVNPVRDIQYLTKHQIMHFDEICVQINGVVNKLLDDNEHLRFNYQKILSVLKEYRSISLKEASCEKYNCFMVSLRERLLERNEELWDKIKDEKLGLISDFEVSSSSVSSEEAKMYLSETCVAKSGNDSTEMSAPCVEDDDDDLMDQL